jgi:adenosylcobyric acid synthase
MSARAVMVLGCTSGAGKSWLATALCRLYSRLGYRVAPFKAQNMSNHARVVATPAGGLGEIGSAQYFQALAARVRPDVRMNPVLLKPESDTRSQVVVMGEVVPKLAMVGWRERSDQLAMFAIDAYLSLANDFDVIVIEGAGSPAEINLAREDYVNLGAARWSQARCLLVSDIDRGGAFAHLYGTYSLMPEDVRRQLAGFVLNRFRGDASLLAPAPQELERLTGIPTLGVIPYVHDHGLPEEDAVPSLSANGGRDRVVVFAGPAASNLDEFEQLRNAGVSVEFVRAQTNLQPTDLIVLPGSKQTRVDLHWLRRSGLDTAVMAHAARGGRVLGICGGLQILGQLISDPDGLEGDGSAQPRGLELLPVTTRFMTMKRVHKTVATAKVPSGPWSCIDGCTMDGYEIHLGITSASDHGCVAVEDSSGAPVGWLNGSVLGIYLHGIFEDPRLMRALFGVSPPSFDVTLDRLADVAEAVFSSELLTRFVER